MLRPINMRDCNINIIEEDEEEEEERWELARAFAEDALRNTTWPPRSYTCSFCRREFRSAQALGGHMNVHRRDRARLHQARNEARSLVICGGGGGVVLCPVYDYQLDNYSAINSISEGNFNPLRSDCLPACRYVNDDNKVVKKNEDEAAIDEELDLELRLGYIPP